VQYSKILFEDQFLIFFSFFLVFLMVRFPDVPTSKNSEYLQDIMLQGSEQLSVCVRWETFAYRYVKG